MKIIYKIFTVGFFILLYFGITSRILYRRVDMPCNKYTYSNYVEAYNILENQKIPNLKILTKDEYKSRIDVKKHIYLEANTRTCYAFPQINTIIMDNSLEGHAYCVFLAHEKIHITKYSANETYVYFETFKFLYESNDTYLKQAGITYGLQQLNDLYFDEKDVKGQIINYLTNNDIYVKIN